MPVRLRPLLANLPILIGLGLVVFYLIFGYLLFPPLAKWGAEKYITSKTGHHLSLTEAKFDPLRLSMSLRGLKLNEPDGKPLLSFDELFIDFEARSLLKWAYTLHDIRLVAPQARLELRPDGSLNWSAFIDAFKDEEENKDDPLPRLLIDRIALEKGSVEFEDKKVEGGFRTRLEPLDFQLTDLSTLPDDKGAYTLSTRNQIGTRIRWRGDLALNPIKASGELAIDDLQLERLWAYVDGRFAMAPPEGKAAVGLAYQASYVDKHFSLLLDKVGMKLEGLTLRGEPGEKPRVALNLLEVSGGRFDLDQRRLSIAQVALHGGLVEAIRRADGSINLQDWFKPGAASGSVPVGAEQAKGVDALDAIKPGDVVRLNGLTFEYKSFKLHKDVLPRLDKVIAALKANADLHVHVAGHTDSVGSEAYNLKLSAGRADAVRDYLLGQGIAPERLVAEGFGESRPIADNATDAGRAENRRVVLRFYLPGETLPPETTDATSQPGPGSDAPWRLMLDRFSVDGLAVRLTDAGFVTPLTVAVDNVQLGLGATAELGQGGPKVTVDGIGVNLTDIRLLAAGTEVPLAAMGGVSLEGGQVDLAKRQARLARLRLSNGRAELLRQAQGEIPLLTALARHPAPAPLNLDKQLVQAAGTPWKYGVERVELSGFGLAVRDEGVRPALVLDLKDIRASVEGVSENLNAALPVQLGFRVAQGGGFEVRGKAVPAKPSVDLRLKLAGLALKPAQPYISQAANLRLASGHVATSGRLRYDKTLRYDGGFSVDGLLLNEADTGERFLAWKTLSSQEFKVTQGGLNIGTLNVDGLGAKLVIYEDKTVNLKKILKAAPAAEGGEAKAIATPGEKKPKSAGPDFKVVIDNVKVSDGEMDFADLSLALPFGTRIHHLEGYLNGISSQGGGVPSLLEFEGKVDDYGLARSKGQISLFDPTGYMDIKTVFRNVEMTRLTPYSATFAGRKIASGKLSLDLEYKIKNRQLQGENQVIMDKLTLGERVESPTAKNLPLDLAIAILSDSNGRIDLGLPVSGSLDDPQFSYGKIIWKAVVNVITKIVTAPFRALGKLLGGGAEKLENLAFDPGSARLLPPERETLKNLAQALEKRPKLALSVQGAWDPKADRAALKESRVRAALAKGLAIKVPEGEAAPPVSMGNTKAQEAIEALYAERLGKDALKVFKARFYQANPDMQSGMDKMLTRLAGAFKGEDKPLSEQEMADLKDKELHALLYRGLIDHEPVADDTLQGLARQRAQAIADELVVVNKVAKERVQIGKSEPLEGDGKSIGIKLSLIVAQAPASASSESSQVAVPSPPQPQPVQ